MGTTVLSRGPCRDVPNSRSKRNAFITDIVYNGSEPRSSFTKITPRTGLVIIGLGETPRGLCSFCFVPSHGVICSRISIVETIRFTSRFTNRGKTPTIFYVTLNYGGKDRAKTRSLSRCLSCVATGENETIITTTNGRTGDERRCGKHVASAISSVRVGIRRSVSKFCLRY